MSLVFTASSSLRSARCSRARRRCGAARRARPSPKMRSPDRQGRGSASPTACLAPSAMFFSFFDRPCRCARPPDGRAHVCTRAYTRVCTQRWRCGTTRRSRRSPTRRANRWGPTEQADGAGRAPRRCRCAGRCRWAPAVDLQVPRTFFSFSFQFRRGSPSPTQAVLGRTFVLYVKQWGTVCQAVGDRMLSSRGPYVKQWGDRMLSSGGTVC